MNEKIIRQPILQQRKLIRQAKLKQIQKLRDRYDPKDEHRNPIFWGTKMDSDVSLMQKIRTFFWFYPDYLTRIIHKLRPISYMIVYAAISLLIWRGLAYAEDNPNSFLHNPPPQELREGIVGTVDKVNPLFVTQNQVERDLQSLVFNKLISVGEDGNPTPELAETWAISADGKTYTFFLRDDVKWQDGMQFTADDVIFTFEIVQEISGENSLSEVFASINIGKIDDFTVVFTLPEKNATFTESLTIGIVPEHILRDVHPSHIKRSEFNKFPIGTGPFQIIENDEEHVLLQKNTEYFKGEPNLETIEYVFYPDPETAQSALYQYQIHTLSQLTESEFGSLSKYPVYDEKDFELYLRQKLIFFNLRNEGPLASESVRQALSAATNREEVMLAAETKGSEALGPIPYTSWAYDETVDRFRFDLERANKLLDQDGWKYSANDSRFREKNGQTLELTLSFLDNDTNSQIAQNIRVQWAQVGAKVNLDTQTYEKIASETIPLRQFDALLFELENTPDPDCYNLWHTVKADYPGLNLSGYSYERVDYRMEQARREIDQTERKELYSKIQDDMMEDMPAVFLYHPTFSFVAHDSVKGIKSISISLPQDRYWNVEEWYISSGT